MAYIDIFLAAVPTDNKLTYLDYAKKMDALFMNAGAIEVVENWGNDVPDGKLTSFPMAVKCEAGETVTAGWIKWKSKAERDAAWEKLMKLPEMQPGANPMPFDGRRMIYGGFETILEL
jgi:uncharacterized protein YbaA (DUF1428 family)